MASPVARHSQRLVVLVFLILTACTAEDTAEPGTTLSPPTTTTSWTSDDYNNVLDFCVAAAESADLSVAACPEALDLARDIYRCNPEGAMRFVADIVDSVDNSGGSDPEREEMQALVEPLVDEGLCLGDSD